TGPERRCQRRRLDVYHLSDVSLLAAVWHVSGHELCRTAMRVWNDDLRVRQNREHLYELRLGLRHLSAYATDEHGDVPGRWARLLLRFHALVVWRRHVCLPMTKSVCQPCPRLVPYRLVIDDNYFCRRNDNYFCRSKRPS